MYQQGSATASRIPNPFHSSLQTGNRTGGLKLSLKTNIEFKMIKKEFLRLQKYQLERWAFFQIRKAKTTTYYVLQEDKGAFPKDWWREAMEQERTKCFWIDELNKSTMWTWYYKSANLPCITQIQQLQSTKPPFGISKIHRRFLYKFHECISQYKTFWLLKRILGRLLKFSQRNGQNKTKQGSSIYTGTPILQIPQPKKSKNIIFTLSTL